MRKIFTFSLAMIFSIALFAQDFVSTDPENKNVVLEEFTGIHCGYCPQGHAIAAEIYENNPDDVVLIAIHTGSYASPNAGEPDFRTEWGDAIAGQSGLTGYPAGTVNRHLFPGMQQGSGTAMSRGDWEAASDIIMDASSYLNVAANAHADLATRELTIDVEVYYTGDSPEATNFLNVAILQSNILGPQSGGGAGDNYSHNHMLRDLITGQWGEEITTTSTGSLIQKSYTYQIPEDYLGVEAVIPDMDIVVFVSETTQEIVSGAKAMFTFTTAYANEVVMGAVEVPSIVCGDAVAPVVSFRNMGNDNLTSLDIVYSVNGGTEETFVWNGDLQTGQQAEVELPAYVYAPLATNDLSVDLTNPNGGTDEVPENNAGEGSFEIAHEAGMTVSLELKTDQYAEEISWKVFNSNDDILYSGGAYGNNQTYNEEFTLTETDCYRFEIYDTYGDGIVAPGYYKLFDATGALFAQGSDYGTLDIVPWHSEAGEVLAAPANFSADVNEYDINLSWDAPAAKATFLGYNVYETSDMSTPLNAAVITETSYTHTVTVSATYEFVLKAVYEEGLSAAVGPVTAIVVVGVEKYDYKYDVSIYPNPLTEESVVSFNLSEQSTVVVDVYNVLGAKVASITNTEMAPGVQTYEMPVDKMGQGVYMINFRINNDTFAKRVIVQ
ncbi:MAG: Omp28-related outer membrane protein [Bacteroidales bacterium]|nr:Omp28-related outer membrane protein [Bacteroidales bacterium]